MPCRGGPSPRAPRRAPLTAHSWRRPGRRTRHLHLEPSSWKSAWKSQRESLFWETGSCSLHKKTDTRRRLPRSTRVTRPLSTTPSSFTGTGPMLPSRNVRATVRSIWLRCQIRAPVPGSVTFSICPPAAASNQAVDIGGHRRGEPDGGASESALRHPSVVAAACGILVTGAGVVGPLRVAHHRSSRRKHPQQVAVTYPFGRRPLSILAQVAPDRLLIAVQGAATGPPQCDGPTPPGSPTETEPSLAGCRSAPTSRS